MRTSVRRWTVVRFWTIVRFSTIGMVMLSTAASVPAAEKRTPKKTSLPEQIRKLLADPSVSRAHWGIAVTTMDGKPLYGLNDAHYFVPASNNKLYTTAASIGLLGPNRTFTTRIAAEGVWPTPASLKGDLVLIGGGEANLSGRNFPYAAHDKTPPKDPLQILAQMADQVVATGLKTINGDVVGDDTLFPWEPYPEDWAIDDTVGDDGSPVSALTINDNRIDLTITPATAQGQPATASFSPATNYYQLDLQVMTGATTRISVDRELGSKLIRVTGTIAVDAQPRVEALAIHDPAEFAAIALKDLLEARGVAVTGIARARHRLPGVEKSFLAQTHDPANLYDVNPPPRIAGKVLVTHTSLPLADDLMLTNKISQNLHAELFLHQLAVSFGNDGSTAQGARIVRNFMMDRAGIDPDDIVLFDGSGMSGHDLVTPRATAQLLRYAATQAWFPQWRASLPIGGEDGTLAARFPSAPMKDHLYAKTGTLSEARALSGYLDTASGKTVIFSVMVSTHYPRTNADRDTMDKIVTAIAAAF